MSTCKKDSPRLEFRPITNTQDFGLYIFTQIIRWLIAVGLVLPCTAVWSSSESPRVADPATQCTTSDDGSKYADHPALNIACKDIRVVVNAGRSVTITPEEIADFSVEDQEPIQLSITEQRTTFGCADVGQHFLTLKVVTSSGQASSCHAMVIVEDNTPAPTATCKNITVQLDLLGAAQIFPSDIDAGNTYPCGYSSLSLDRLSFSSADMDKENIVILTATGRDGQASSCQATVTVVDRIEPSLTCPQNTIVNTDQRVNGAYIKFVKATAVDNCGVTDLLSRFRPLDDQDLTPANWSSWEVDHSSFFTPGAYEIQWLAADRSGNQARCTTQLSLSALAAQ